MLINYFAGMT